MRLYARLFVLVRSELRTQFPAQFIAQNLSVARFSASFSRVSASRTAGACELSVLRPRLARVVVCPSALVVLRGLSVLVVAIVIVRIIIGRV